MVACVAPILRRLKQGYQSSRSDQATQGDLKDSIKKIIKRPELVKKEKDLCWNITLLWTLGFDLNFLKFMLHKYSFIFLLNFLLHLYIYCVCPHVCRGIGMPWCACGGYSMIFFDVVFFVYDVGSRVQIWLIRLGGKSLYLSPNPSIFFPNHLKR